MSVRANRDNLDSGDRSSDAKEQWFASTHWSVVLAASQNGTPTGHEALEHLCRAYWYPLYAYVRRQNYSPHDAQDLTQAFFERLLEKNYVAQANPSRGRFRSFLLAALKHFLADEWDKARAQKRGGGQPLFSLDAENAESRYHLEPVDSNGPEKIYDRRWALTVLEEAVFRLRTEYVAVGKADLFEQLRRFEAGEIESTSYADMAAQLAMPENTFKSHLRRLRQRNRELVRAVIAETVTTPGDIDGEIRYLLAVLGE